MDATRAHRQARPGTRVIGWLLDPSAREQLLRSLPPRYERVVAHHVTLRPRVSPASRLPQERSGEIVGVSDDGQGVQALVIRIEGSTRRPDGGTYHITWSLAPGRRPVESNEVIAARGWSPVDPPVPVPLQPDLVG